MRACVGLVLTLVTVSLYGASIGEAAVRDVFNGSHRVLLVFSPVEGDPRAGRLDALLEEKRCGVAERDLVIGRLPLTGEATLGGAPISHVAAVRLREQYRIGDDRFSVILIGKDGGEKSRHAEVPDLARLFALIDGMPMRREEMRGRTANCGA